ncbi:MAG: sulfatase-like hydrolase/transferase [Bacilli bacterium]|nr:sulfatase-like hydrolase/transferase [Bacilli bacterium]
MNINIKKHGRLFEFSILFTLFLFFEILMSIRYEISIYLPYYFITFASIALVPGLLVLVHKNKLRFTLYALYIFFGFAIFVADTCLFHYKEDIFSWAMLKDVGDGLTMGIKYNIFIAFPWWEWMIILVVCGLLIGFLMKIMLGPNKVEAPFKWSRLLYLSLAILTLLSSGFYLKEVDLYLYQVPQDKRTYLLTFGFSSFNKQDALQTLENFIMNGQIRLDASEMIDDVDDTTNTTPSHLFGSFEDKNVIMIMTETVEQYAMDPILTPILWNLYHSGYYFTQTYGVAKTNYTYDAEFKSLTSMMYYNNDNIMHTYADNQFTNSLPSLLKNEGYTVNAFHSFYGHYFNRDEMYEALGFEHYYAYEEMEFSEVDFWPLDSEFFGQNLDLMAPVQEDPFFSFVITLSTHGAFREQRSEFAPYYPLIEADGRYTGHDEEFINLLAAQMDLDRGLELLVEDLIAKNLLADTVIVLFSDHKNYSSIEVTKEYTPLEHEYELYNYEYDIIPFAIYNPTITTRGISSLTSQYDIMPTLCDLLGIPLVADYVYGQSVFLYDTDQYVDKPIILGYNRWVSKNLIVYDKQIVYVDPAVDNPMDLMVSMQNDIYQTIEQFHAYFLTDYFRKTAD